MILDPYGEILVESRELGDDVVVALSDRRENRGFVRAALSAGTPARALWQARRAAAAGPGARYHTGLEGRLTSQA